MKTLIPKKALFVLESAPWISVNTYEALVHLATQPLVHLDQLDAVHR